MGIVAFANPADIPCNHRADQLMPGDTTCIWAALIFTKLTHRHSPDEHHSAVTAQYHQPPEWAGALEPCLLSRALA
jgi:hypothetical protein